MKNFSTVGYSVKVVASLPHDRFRRCLYFGDCLHQSFWEGKNQGLWLKRSVLIMDNASPGHMGPSVRN